MIMDAQIFCHKIFIFLIEHVTSNTRTYKEDSVKTLYL
jgi:hypothetical protein